MVGLAELLPLDGGGSCGIFLLVGDARADWSLLWVVFGSAKKGLLFARITRVRVWQLRIVRVRVAFYAANTWALVTL